MGFVSPNQRSCGSASFFFKLIRIRFPFVAGPDQTTSKQHMRVLSQVLDRSENQAIFLLASQQSQLYCFSVLSSSYSQMSLFSIFCTGKFSGKASNWNRFRFGIRIRQNDADLTGSTTLISCLRRFPGSIHHCTVHAQLLRVKYK